MEENYIHLYDPETMKDYLFFLLKQKHCVGCNFSGIWCILQRTVNFHHMFSSLNLQFYFEVMKLAYNAYPIKENLLENAMNSVIQTCIKEAQEHAHVQCLLKKMKTDNKLQKQKKIQKKIAKIIHS